MTVAFLSPEKTTDEKVIDRSSKDDQKPKKFLHFNTRYKTNGFVHRTKKNSFVSSSSTMNTSNQSSSSSTFYGSQGKKVSSPSAAPTSTAATSSNLSSSTSNSLPSRPIPSSLRNILHFNIFSTCICPSVIDEILKIHPPFSEIIYEPPHFPHQCLGLLNEHERSLNNLLVNYQEKVSHCLKPLSTALELVQQVENKEFRQLVLQTLNDTQLLVLNVLQNMTEDRRSILKNKFAGVKSATSENGLFSVDELTQLVNGMLVDRSFDEKMADQEKLVDNKGNPSAHSSSSSNIVSQNNSTNPVSASTKTISTKNDRNFIGQKGKKYVSKKNSSVSKNHPSSVPSGNSNSTPTSTPSDDSTSTLISPTSLEGEIENSAGLENKENFRLKDSDGNSGSTNSKNAAASNNYSSTIPASSTEKNPVSGEKSNVEREKRSNYYRRNHRFYGNYASGSVQYDGFGYSGNRYYGRPYYRKY